MNPAFHVPNLSLPYPMRELSIYVRGMDIILPLNNHVRPQISHISHKNSDLLLGNPMNRPMLQVSTNKDRRP